MDSGGLNTNVLLLFLSVCLGFITGEPIGTSVINCNGGSNIKVGTVDEGYVGDVELVTGITSGSEVKLVSYIFPKHLEYLELGFSIGDTSATVRTKKPLDADPQELIESGGTLYYSIMCVGFINYNNTRTLELNDLNDNAPVFEKSFYNATVTEADEPETEVLRVTAKDADSTITNNRFTYSLTPVSEDFTLTTSGAFILEKRQNYNLVQKYNFVVTATDDGGLSSSTSVLINVKDLDNLNPYFSHSLYRASIPENQVGSFSSIEPEAIKAQDGDTGINMAVTYSISSVSPEKYEGHFSINSNTGVVSVVTQFDREEMDSGVVSVTVKAAQIDDALKTAETVVSVTVEDVNDNPPEFDPPDFSATLLENSPVGAFVVKVNVRDRDQGGFVGTLGILPESAPFSVDADGTVRVKDSSVLDRETTRGFIFEVVATESEPPRHNETAPVNVTLLDENDNSPVFSSDTYEGKVFANQTEGMLLVQVNAEDADLGRNGRVKYSIEFGNKDGHFSMDEDTGELTLAKTIPLEENMVREFSLYVAARDEGVIPRFTIAQVKIRAPGDSKPQFLHKVFRGTIEEEQEPGVLVIRVNFFPSAPALPVTLTVNTEGDKFAISPKGEVTTKVKLDYDEAPQNYSVGISISDGSSSDSAVVEVTVTDINDNSPVFSSSSVESSVPEDTEVGTNVTAVKATDKDSGFNKEIRYSLRGGGGRFSVDPLTGMVSVAGGLDRETTASYELLVVAEDQGRPARSATATLLVDVTDVNDNAPVFSEAQYQVEVLETESEGMNLLTVTASDADEGANGRVSYSLLQQTPPSDPPVFELDSSNGILQLVQGLDYSQVKVYSLLVQASDGGSPSLSGNSTVVVKVKDVNNNPPEFSQDTYHVAVSENLASGASILTLEVTDKDEGGFSRGHFLFSSDTFDINKQGVFSLRKDASLDRETIDGYVIQVLAVDQPKDALTSTAMINVTVLDYNDNSPQFPPLPDPLLILEGEYSKEAPGEVFTIVPTDADIGLNAEVTVSLAAPHPLFTFREDGTLLAVGPLDRESRETFELLVTAADKGVPQRENITTVRVKLIDVNDNAPQFSASGYVSSILLEDAEVGKVLLTLSATDKDAGDNAKISYSISEGGSPYVALNTETGELILTSDLADVTEDTTVLLTVMAKDHGEPPLNATARVQVNLRVVSLVEGVAFKNPSYNFSLPENQPKGAPVGAVWASAGSDIYEVSYALKTHTDLFAIDADGAIVTKESLDKEEQEWFILEVEAVDTRAPPTSALAVVRVQVEDVNEAPAFSSEDYEASVFSIAPYKTSVITVKASDPDVGDTAQLVYSLSDRRHFDVDSSSGLVFVVSAATLAGESVTLEVKVTDPQGLSATAKVEVEVQGSASSSDVVVISLNQAANTVEEKVPELEKSLGSVLGWTVNIIEVSSANGGTPESRSMRAGTRTLVSFVSEDEEGVVSPQDVTEKLQSQSAAVTAELSKVFGNELQFDIEQGPGSPASNQAAVIALGVLLALSMLGLIVAVVFIFRFKKMDKLERSSDRESFEIDRRGEGYTNWPGMIPEPSKTSRQDDMKDEQKTDEQKTDDNATRNTNGSGVRFKPGEETDAENDRGSRF